MNCIHCGEAMKRSTAPIHVGRHGYQLSFGAVPSWICGQCGEPYFEEREVDAIQGAIRTLDEQIRHLAANDAATLQHDAT